MPLTDEDLQSTWALFWSEPDSERGNIALEILVQHYSHLAAYFARQAIARAPAWQDPDDLLAYAHHGLLKAIRSYDPDAGAKFETWATRTIPKRIMDGQRQMDPLKRPDRALVKLLQSARESFFEQHQREPNAIQLADEMRVPIEQVRMTQMMEKTLTVTLDDDERSGWHGDDAHFRRHFDDTEVQEADARSYLARRLASLGERGRAFVLAYYCDEKNITDISRETPVSPDWARLTRNQVWDALTR